MCLHRALADPEASGDLLVGEALAHQLDHLRLAGRQVRTGRSRSCGPGTQQLSSRARVDRRLAAADRADPGQHLLGVGVLEEVAQGTRVEGGHDPLRVGEGGQHQDVGQAFGRDGPRRLDAVDPGHLQVHQDDVGSRLRDDCDRLGAVAGGPDHLDVRRPRREAARAPGVRRHGRRPRRRGSAPRSSRSHVQPHGRALPRSGGHVEATARVGDQAGQASQPEVPGAGRLGAVEAAAVVDDLEGDGPR